MATSVAPYQGIAFDLPHTRAPATLFVESPAFGHRQPIPRACSAYGAGEAPEITWGNVPDGTRSLAMICEDPDAHEPRPFVHWLLYNIPPDATSTRVAGAACRGTNSRGEPGYYGPHPPEGDGPHHYHFQVFALDSRPPLPNGAERIKVLEAIAGHVIAKGELIGTFEAP